MSGSLPIVTQRDIARELGVSNATVSLALRDSPRIPEARRREIRELAEQMGYRPNPAAAALAYQKRSSGKIPIHASLAWFNLWPRPEELRMSPLFDAYWRGASECAEKFGYRLEEVCLAGSTGRRVEKILKTRGVDGIVLSPGDYRSPMDLRDFRWEKFRAIRTSRLPLEPALHLVTADQAGNTMLAVDRIRAKGYKRVGFVCFARSPGDRNWRFESGYLTVQQEMEEDERIPVYRLDAGDPASRSGLAAWLAKYRPDALLSLHPELREILVSLGYDVPGDIGLAALNVADCHIDAGIDQNPREIGRHALLMLLSMIHDNDYGIPENPRETLIKGRWVDGPTLPDRRLLTG